MDRNDRRPSVPIGIEDIVEAGRSFKKRDVHVHLQDRSQGESLASDSVFYVSTSF